MLRACLAELIRRRRLARLAREAPQRAAAEQEEAVRRLIDQARAEWS